MEHVLHHECPGAGGALSDAAKSGEAAGYEDQRQDGSKRDGRGQDSGGTDEHGAAFCSARDNASIEPESTISLGRIRRPSSGGRSGDLAQRRPTWSVKPVMSMVRPDSRKDFARLSTLVSSSANAQIASVGSMEMVSVIRAIRTQANY